MKNTSKIFLAASAATALTAVFGIMAHKALLIHKARPQVKVIDKRCRISNKNTATYVLITKTKSDLFGFEHVVAEEIVVPYEKYRDIHIGDMIGVFESDSVKGILLGRRELSSIRPATAVELQPMTVNDTDTAKVNNTAKEGDFEI